MVCTLLFFDDCTTNNMRHDNFSKLQWFALVEGNKRLVDCLTKKGDSARAVMKVIRTGRKEDEEKIVWKKWFATSSPKGNTKQEGGLGQK